MGKLTILFGTVVRTSNTNCREVMKDFQCKQCQKIHVCESDISEFNRFALPVRCDAKQLKKFNPF